MLHVTLLLLASLAAPAGTLYAIDPGASRLTYRVVHKLHEVEGSSRSIEARALHASDGALQVMARAPVTSFVSGDGNRDEHMLEVIEAGRFPWVVLKAAGRVLPPATLPAQVETVLEGELDFHGVKLPEKIPVILVFAADGSVHVSAHFDVSLERYRVERPSLLFVKVDDACAIVAELTVKKASP
jgi:hypothetical protein